MENTSTTKAQNGWKRCWIYRFYRQTDATERKTKTIKFDELKRKSKSETKITIRSVISVRNGKKYRYSLKVPLLYRIKKYNPSFFFSTVWRALSNIYIEIDRPLPRTRMTGNIAFIISRPILCCSRIIILLYYAVLLRSENLCVTIVDEHIYSNVINSAVS